MFEKKTQGFLGDYKKPYAYIYCFIPLYIGITIFVCETIFGRYYFLLITSNEFLVHLDE